MMHVGVIQKDDEPEPAKVQLYHPRDIFYFKNQEECQRVSRLREKVRAPSPVPDPSKDKIPNLPSRKISKKTTPFPATSKEREIKVDEVLEVDVEA